MPLIYYTQVQPEGVLGVWEITESEDWFSGQLSLSEAEERQFRAIKGSRRRIEWLAARQLVHALSGREVRGPFLKDEHGKPHLEGSSYQISISHSGQLAAAIAAPVACGIDIQFPVGKIGRLAPKFLREEERQSLASGAYRLGHLHVLWGAKEALYKAYGRRQIDWCAHLGVEPFPYPPEAGQARGWVDKEAGRHAFEVHFQLLGPATLVYVLASSHPG